MKFLKLSLLLLCGLLLITTQVHALLIDPTEEPGSVDLILGTNYWTDVGTPIETKTGTSDIYDYLQDQFGYNEVWKSDEGGLALSNSYEVTSWIGSEDEETGGDIEYVSGMDTLAPTAYMLVKDGNASPVWYFFDLTALGWNYTEKLELRNFWLQNGAISHVGLGGPTAPIPEPATMLLLGTGIIGLAGIGRKRFKKN